MGKWNFQGPLSAPLESHCGLAESRTADGCPLVLHNRFQRRCADVVVDIEMQRDASSGGYLVVCQGETIHFAGTTGTRPAKPPNSPRSRTTESDQVTGLWSIRFQADALPTERMRRSCRISVPTVQNATERSSCPMGRCITTRTISILTSPFPLTKCRYPRLSIITAHTAGRISLSRSRSIQMTTRRSSRLRKSQFRLTHHQPIGTRDMSSTVEFQPSLRARLDSAIWHRLRCTLLSVSRLPYWPPVISRCQSLWHSTRLGIAAVVRQYDLVGVHVWGRPLT